MYVRRVNTQIYTIYTNNSYKLCYRIRDLTNAYYIRKTFIGVCIAPLQILATHVTLFVFAEHFI